MRCSPVGGREVEGDGAAVREADGEGLVVGVAEGDDATIARLDDLQRLGDHRTLDAPARHGAGHLAVLVHGHGRTGEPRPAPLDVDDPPHADLLSGPSPAVEVAETLTPGASHRRRRDRKNDVPGTMLSVRVN